MTQTLSPEDTGEIPAPTLGNTQNIAPYAYGLRPKLRRPDITGEFVVYGPATIGVVGEFEPQPTGNPPPLPPEPAPTPPGKSWWQRLTYRGVHRPAPDDAGWPVTIGLVVGLVLIGAGVLLAVTW